MAEFRRTIRKVHSNRTNPFGPIVTTEEEDEYHIEAESAGEVCVIIQTHEREKGEEAAP